MAKRKTTQQELEDIELPSKLPSWLREQVQREMADIMARHEEPFDDYKVYHSGELVAEIRNYRRGFIYAIRAIDPDYEVVMVSPQGTEEEEP